MQDASHVVGPQRVIRPIGEARAPQAEVGPQQVSLLHRLQLFLLRSMAARATYHTAC